MIVADTNLIAYFLIEGEFTTKAEAVYQQDTDWIAPYLWRSEFCNILALYLRQNLISLEEAVEIMDRSQLLLINKEWEVDLDLVLKLTSVSNLTAYDCEYVALANKLNIPLVTSDLQIIKAFPKVAISLTDFSKL